jgi:hypothetical protein
VHGTDHRRNAHAAGRDATVTYHARALLDAAAKTVLIHGRRLGVQQVSQRALGDKRQRTCMRHKQAAAVLLQHFHSPCSEHVSERVRKGSSESASERERESE